MSGRVLSDQQNARTLRQAKRTHSPTSKTRALLSTATTDHTVSNQLGGPPSSQTGNYVPHVMHTGRLNRCGCTEPRLIQEFSINCPQLPLRREVPATGPCRADGTAAVDGQPDARRRLHELRRDRSWKHSLMCHRRRPCGHGGYPSGARPSLSVLGSTI